MRRATTAAPALALLALVACGGPPSSPPLPVAGPAGSEASRPAAEASARPTSTAGRDGSGGRSCSATEASTIAPEAQPGLPAPVARTRQQILAAARACDYDALGRVALEGDQGFTYSFGDDGHPGEFWQQQEEHGEEPLRHLIAVLQLPYRYLGEHDQYVWPAAFGYDTWDDIPDGDKQDLSALYTQQERERFRMFGAYIGFRVGIGADGRWLFFVAGD